MWFLTEDKYQKRIIVPLFMDEMVMFSNVFTNVDDHTG